MEILFLNKLKLLQEQISLVGTLNFIDFPRTIQILMSFLASLQKLFYQQPQSFPLYAYLPK